MERKGNDGSGTSDENNFLVIENRVGSQVPETSLSSMNTDRNTELHILQSLESAKSTVSNDPLRKSGMHLDEINTGLVPFAAGISTTPCTEDQLRSSSESQGQELPSPDTITISAATGSSGIDLVTKCHEVDETKLPDANEPNEAQLNEEVKIINENNSFQVVELQDDPNNPYITHWDSDSDERCTPPSIELPIRPKYENRGQNRGVSRDARHRDRCPAWRPHADSSRIASYRDSGIASSSTSGRSHSNSGHGSVNPRMDQQNYQDFGGKQTKKRKHSDCSLEKGDPDCKNPRVHPPNLAASDLTVDVNSRMLDYLSYLLEFPVKMISTTNTNLEAAGVQELASAMITLIVKTPEHEYLTHISGDRSVSDRPLIPRFHKLLAVVKTLSVERVVAFLEHFNTRVIPNEKLGKLENEQLLLNIGLLIGSITFHFRQPDLGLDMLFNFLLCRPPCAYSFAHGLLSKNIFIIGYKDFWGLCRKRRAVLISIFKNPRFSDVRFAQPVVEMIKKRLSFKVPEITFSQFRGEFVEHIFTLKRDDEEVNNCAHILAMLVVQKGAACFEGPFTIKLDDWTKMWRNGKITNEAFACFIKTVGIIAEALGSSDETLDTQKHQDLLMAIGNITNVPPMIMECVNKSVQKLLGAVAVPIKPFEKWELEKPETPAQPGPTAAKGSSRKKSRSWYW